MKKIIVFLFLLFLIKQSISQNHRFVDSLKEKLSVEKRLDTNRVINYLHLAGIYIFSKPDTSVYYANKALLLSQQLKFNEGILRSLCTKAFPLSVLRSDSAAVSCAYQAVKIAETGKNRTDLVRAYFTLGSVYIHIREYRKSIIYHRKVITFLERTETDQMSGCWQHLAESFIGLKQTDSAFFYIQKVLADDKVNNRIVPYNTYMMGSVFFLKDDYANALKYYKESLKQDANETKKDATDCNIGIANAFQKLGRPDSAIFYTRTALKVANRTGLPNEKLEALNLLEGLFEYNLDIDSAFKYQKSASLLKDSIYNLDKIRQVQLIAFNDRIAEQAEAERQSKLFNKITIYSLMVALGFSLIIGAIILSNNRHRKKAYALLKGQQQEIVEQKAKVEQTLRDLKSTQTQLIQSEKMASLGELTAGIAHEIQNPLNFVNNFSEVNTEMIDELRSELKSGNIDEALIIAAEIKENEQKISHHGKRADNIVKGMLQHSNTGTGAKEPTNINALADEYIRLAYHGLRAKDKSFNAKLTSYFDPELPKITVVAQDIGRVLLNLFNNAFYAVHQKQKTADMDYKPEVTVTSYAENGHVIIKVKDNGIGIPDAIKDKIMQPFFTTKPTGEGTGLGLSLSYDMVVKGHGGQITIDSKEGKLTEFTIQLPISNL
ncbi:MAG: hypothetical protein JWP78_1025 [Mucilaginibacter sp.]|nr:hypothetical protein [Mucilaginibacter sp.]